MPRRVRTCRTHALHCACSRVPPRTTMDEEGHNEAARLVLNYLIHHEYAKTAEAFQTRLGHAPTRAASPALPVPPPASASAPGPDIDSPMLSADHGNEGVGMNMLELRRRCPLAPPGHRTPLSPQLLRPHSTNESAPVSNSKTPSSTRYETGTRATLHHKACQRVCGQAVRSTHPRVRGFNSRTRSRVQHTSGVVCYPFS